MKIPKPETLLFIILFPLIIHPLHCHCLSDYITWYLLYLQTICKQWMIKFLLLLLRFNVSFIKCSVSSWRVALNSEPQPRKPVLRSIEQSKSSIFSRSQHQVQLMLSNLSSGLNFVPKFPSISILYSIYRVICIILMRLWNQQYLFLSHLTSVLPSNFSPSLKIYVFQLGLHFIVK